MDLECWKCGAVFRDLLTPMARSEACPECHADLHVCRQCAFHDRRAPNECREPVAEPVKDKDRANFCGYFTPDARPPRADSAAAAVAQRQFAELFGDAPPATVGESKDGGEAARRALDELFGTDEPKS